MRQTDEFPLDDPRGYFFSCYDAGGADWTDDWAFIPVGGFGKYDSMGFVVHKSPFMRNLAPVFQVLLSIRRGPDYFHQWGNLFVDLAVGDLARISAPHWPWRETAMRGRVTLPLPNTLLWELELESRADEPIELEFAACAIPYPSADGEFVLSGTGNGLALSHETKGCLALVGRGFECQDQNRLTLKTTLHPGTPARMRLAFSVRQDEPTLAARRAVDALGLDADDFEARVRDFFRKVPVRGVADPGRRRLIFKLFNDKRINCFKLGDGRFFEVPDRPLHKGQWLWDSVFHALAWSVCDPGLATAILLNLLRDQDPETGWIPINTIDPDRVETYASQPPIIAWAADELLEDEAAIREAYPRLVAFHGWWERERKLGNGLFSWRTGGESGMDNSPRFDPDIHRVDHEADKNHCGRDLLAARLGCIDLCSMMALSAKSLAGLARKADRPLEEAMAWESYHQSICAGINNFLWDEEDGFYYDRHQDGTWRKLKTVASFWTLIAGAARGERARALARKLTDPKLFWTEYPIPSVSIDSPQFQLNYWRGPTWPNINYAVCRGLRAAGFESEAAALARKTVEMVMSEYHRTGHIWECYNPFGDGVERVEKKRQGPRQVAEHFCGWTATAANLILEFPQP